MHHFAYYLHLESNKVVHVTNSEHQKPALSVKCFDEHKVAGPHYNLYQNKFFLNRDGKFYF